MTLLRKAYGGQEIDWQTVETLVASERRPFYQSALKEAEVERNQLQEKLWQAMDRIALLKYKLRETPLREDATEGGPALHRLGEGGPSDFD
jgi:hypothetical protein